jgi:DNA topoisomerase-2
MIKKRTIPDFIDNEFRQFSLADINRSIPDLCDGLKPSTRKILYTVIKKGYRGESNKVKVATLSGAIQETCSYHHSEAGLNIAIVGMAQDFTGSNNINLLIPKGMFGTRRCGGSDAAAPRYIQTYLSNVAEKIFIKADENLLEYLFDDGQQIEPVRFFPIVPMTLVNGAEGIGTGWSTFIPAHNIKDLISWLKSKIKKKKFTGEILPWYRNFNGSIEKLQENQYATWGEVERISTSKIKITELPIGVWTDKYVEHLNKLQDEQHIKNYRIISNGAGSTPPAFEIDLTREKLKSLEDDKQLLEFLKLKSILNTANMHLISRGKIKKYDTIYDICEEFYLERLELYKARKVKQLSVLEVEKNRMREIARFIQLVVSDKLILAKRKKADILVDLEKNSFIKINESYDYLTGISIWSLTAEQIESLNRRADEAQKEYDELLNTKEEDIWYKELSELEKVL